MKPLVILNPNSQGGKTGRCADKLERVIVHHLGAVDRVHTERPRHAVDIAERAASEGRELVIAIGGDGTIHEVSNGLMRARAAGKTVPKLGIVGQGTGGDFRKSLELEHRLDHYCRTIAAGHTRSVDIGSFSFRTHEGERDQAYFINILSAGMGGLADRYVAEASRRFGGSAAYFGASVKALIKCEIGVLKCTIHRGDQTEEREIASRLLAICNGRFFGSGMEVAPMAQPDDGLFHVVSLGAAPKLKFMLSTLSIYKGDHLNNPEVEVFACDRIEIELLNEPVRDLFLLDVDGEPLGTLPMEVELIPGALEIFAPALG